MARSRGRPLGSKVRRNIIDLLYHLGEAYGYQIHKAYKELFSPVTLRTVYYHLKKGVELGIIEVAEIEEERGEYSWGDSAEKTYYRLTDQADPQPQEEIQEFINNEF